MDPLAPPRPVTPESPDFPSPVPSGGCRARDLQAEDYFLSNIDNYRTLYRMEHNTAHPSPMRWARRISDGGMELIHDGRPVIPCPASAYRWDAGTIQAWANYKRS